MREEEKQIYGTKWSNIVNGHFSNPDISSPFIKFITKRLIETTPDVVVDIGGGTGFLLSQLIDNGIDDIKKNIKLVNIDVSKAQIKAIINKRIIGYEASVTNFLDHFLIKMMIKK